VKQAVDIPSRAIEFSGILEFLNLTPGNSYNVKLTTVDIYDNMIAREECLTISDVTAPVINEFNTYILVPGYITVDVHVSDDSGGSVLAIAYLY
jgi:hypothetical protein